MAALRVEVVETPDAAFFSEWQTFLDERASERHLEHEPLFSRAEHLLHPDRPPYLVVARRNEKIVGLAVCTRFRAPLNLSVSVVRFRKIRAWTLKVFGNDFAYDRDEDPKVIASAILEELATRGSEIDILPFYELLEESVIYRLFEEGKKRIHGFSLEPTSSQAEVAHIARLPKTFDELLGRLSKEKRSRVKRAVKLGETNEFRVEEFKTVESVPKFLQILEVLYPLTWQSRTFGSRPRSAEHLTMLAERGWFRSFVLFEGERAIAFALGFQYQDTYIYEEPGYDLETASKSPGYTLLCLLIELLYKDRPPSTLDFGYGDNLYKRVFSTEQLAVRSVVVVRPATYRALYRGQRAVGRIYEDLRKELIRRGYDTKLRNLLKHRLPQRAS